MRDFKVDPIDPTNVEELRKSIKEDGFWGGVVARRQNGGFEIAAGHHRVNAAIKAGIKEADIFVLDRDNADDGTMVRVYCRENATQRGNTSAAASGSVAAAVRFLAKAIMMGADMSRFLDMSPKAVESLRGNLASDKGLGEPIVSDFLKDLPGCTTYTVASHLANLKASGDYARIIGEVRGEIEKEHAEAVRELERARREQAKAAEARAKAEAERKAASERAKAARDEEARKRARRDELEAEARARLAVERQAALEKEAASIKGGAAVEAARAADTAAGSREVTFDLAVNQILTNDNHLNIFKKAVTGPGIAPYLAVNKQAALAKALVKQAAELETELSGAFIREHVVDMVLRVKTKERALSREERDALRNKDFESKFDGALDDFCRSVRGMNAAGIEILSLLKRRPEGSHLKITGEFRSNLSTAKNVIAKLAKEF
jgi:hypothetical protein